MKPRLFFAKLRLGNQLHHARSVNAIGNAKASGKIAKARDKHIKKLQKNALFKKLFKKPVSFSHLAKEGERKYSILTTGAKEVKLYLQGSDLGLQPHNVCFVMDPLGRVRFFAKPTKIKNKSWTEIRGLSLTYRLSRNPNTKSNEREYYLKTKEKAGFSNSDNTALFTALTKVEKEINFDPEINIQDLRKIQNYL